MSTEPGGKLAAHDLVDESKDLLERAQAEGEQLELLDPLTPEELAEAREEMGGNAGGISVVRRAREKRKGRKPGSRNKRTDDFARYIMQFGQDPAITLMQIQSTATEILVERSRRTVTKVTDKGEKVEYDVAMSYEQAESLRIRCAEGLMPFIHSKKPVAVDATIRGVVVHEEIGELRRAGGKAIDGEILGVALPDTGDHGDEG